MAACGCFTGLLLLAGCNQPAPVDTKAVAQAVKNADAQWSKAAAAHDLTTLLSYYAEDAVALPANEELLTNHPGIQKSWIARLAPGVSLSWTPMYVEAAKSGDLAYILVRTPGRPRRQGQAGDRPREIPRRVEEAGDGTWKVEADMWNSDLPAKGK